MPEWVVSAINSTGEKSTGFEEETEETEDPGTGIGIGPDPEHGENDWEVHSPSLHSKRHV